MGTNVIYYQGRRYYLFDVYENWYDTRKAIRHYTKRFKRRGKKLHYYVLVKEGGIMYPRKQYCLYFDKVRRIIS